MWLDWDSRLLGCECVERQERARMTGRKKGITVNLIGSYVNPVSLAFPHVSPCSGLSC